MSSIKNQYYLLRDFFTKEVRTVFFLSLGLFVLLAGVTSVILMQFPTFTEAVTQNVTERVLDKATDSSGEIHFLRILFNNLLACAVMVLLGYMPRLHLSLLSLGVNAVVVGLMGAFYTANTLGIAVFFAGVLPHGIVEIPAIALSTALGICLCKSMGTKFVEGFKSSQHKVQIKKIARFFFIVNVPLIILAAVLEYFVTPVVMKWVM